MSLTCPICPHAFDVSLTAQVTDHLREKHNLIINKSNEIPDSEVDRYLNHWRQVFSRKSLDQVCARNNDGFYVICPDRLSEEKSLRNKLHLDRLSRILKVQEKERSGYQFTRQCIFCLQILTGTKAQFLDHLGIKHNFSIGHPDNIVHIEEFIDLIDQQLKQLKCLWCEGSFKTWESLKEHMRKKNHRQLSADNKLYDKYYLINYLEPGKDWRILAGEPSNLQSTEDDEINAWEDWIEDDTDVSFLCLFCSQSLSSIDCLSSHLLSSHRFDFNSVNAWPFYKKVRLINFIRQCSHQKVCFYCRVSFETQSSLEEHLTSSEHSSCLPEESTWLTPASFIPVNRDDALLYLLDSQQGESSQLEDPESDADESVIVLPEDSSPSKVSSVASTTS